MKSKTAFLYGPGDLRIDEVEVPAIETRSGTDPNRCLRHLRLGRGMFRGAFSEGRYDIGPYTPGHEWGGEIWRSAVRLNT